MYLNYKFAFCPPGGKSFIHVNDAAIAICNAIEEGKNGTCYLLAGENMTYHEFFQKIRKVTGVSKPIIKLNRYFISQLGIAGSIFNKIGCNIELDQANAGILNIKNYYSSARAVEELKMSQTPIENAINDAYRWFRENNYLKCHFTNELAKTQY